MHITIESGQYYQISFDIKKISNFNNFIYFDFFGDGYDNPQQEFNVKPTELYKNFEKINYLIKAGEVPSGTDIYFRIFTDSSGSVAIKNLAIRKIIR